MATSKIPPTILASLKVSQDNLGDVPKDSTNSYHKYKYTSAEQMITSCREALLSGGLVFSELHAEMIHLVDKLCAARVTYRLQHPESGESFEWTRDFPIVPEKGRPLDKAFAGTLTTSLNYALRGLLLVPRVDPLDEMDHGDRDSAPSPKKAAPKKARSASTSTSNPPPPVLMNGEFDKGDTVQTAAGNVGTLFWIGGDRGDRVGVSWGEGDDEKEWTYMRFLSKPEDKTMATRMVNDGVDQDERGESFDDGAEIPF